MKYAVWETGTDNIVIVDADSADAAIEAGRRESPKMDACQPKVCGARLITACDKIARRCVTIGGGYHGSPWLFDQAMRAFEFDPTESVTYEVFIGMPVMEPGEVTIHRDGRFEIRRKEESER